MGDIRRSGCRSVRSHEDSSVQLGLAAFQDSLRVEGSLDAEKLSALVIWLLLCKSFAMSRVSNVALIPALDNRPDTCHLNDSEINT